MLQRVISLDCGARQLAQAREALGSVRGVVAAELIMGRSAIRVWQGEELGEQALIDALTRCGLSAVEID